jgi:hypothetical protein
VCVCIEELGGEDAGKELTDAREDGEKDKSQCELSNCSGCSDPRCAPAREAAHQRWLRNQRLATWNARMQQSPPEGGDEGVATNGGEGGDKDEEEAEEQGEDAAAW